MAVSVIDNNSLLKDGYDGTGGFQTGTYLTQHKREHSSNFEDRKAMAYYLNYLQPIVNSHVNPLFRTPPTRNWNGKTSSAVDGLSGTTMPTTISAAPTAYWESFINDVDMHGTNLTSFMKKAAQSAKLHGVTFIVIDNVPEQPSTQAQALAKRAFPYAYIVDKTRVTSTREDRAGRIIEITYSERAEAITPSAKPGELQYRTWTLQETFLSDKDGVRLKGGANSVTHGLGILPVVPLFARLATPGVTLPESEFLSVARTNLRVYNLCSEIDELLRGQAFSILCYPGTDASSLTLGPNNALGFDGKESRFAPSFIAPAAAPADWLMRLLDKLIQEMYRMALLTHVSGQQVEQRTGLSKAWDFESTNQVLADFASNCQAAEFNMAKVFQVWTKQDLQYSCTYSSDFSVTDTLDELNELKAAKDIVPNGLGAVAIMKKALVVALRGTDANGLKLLLDDLDTIGQNKPATSDDSGGTKSGDNNV